MKTAAKTSIQFLMSLLLLSLASHNVQAQTTLVRRRMYKLSVQELQSPNGPRHSAGIISSGVGSTAAGTAAGLVTFANELVVPGTGGFNGGTPAGTQTGHCVMVWDNTQLACYFNFALLDGRILAEALFDLTNFPNANLVITGGSGKYLGIVGTGKTRAPDVFDGTTFFYDFEYTTLA
jgi:hypothetical protein